MTQQAILDAARTRFSTQGYDGATIRGIARLAEVDPALVHHYYGNKERLFAAAMELPVDPAATAQELLAHGVDDLGRNLVRLFLRLWDDEGRHPLVALVRSAVGNDRAAAMVREFFTREILERVAAALGTPDAQLRASLVASQLMGVAMARHLIGIEPLASADAEVVVAAVAPTLQRYLTGDLGTNGTTVPPGRLSPAHNTNQEQ